ncbi:MAG: DUF1343 domain-containing protein [Thermoanaerobaculia bacterium]|nr:DUF1343 domain-containing protein [Thermoanaerobaculia bacterium]
MIATGLDRLLEQPEALAGRRFGLLAHGASVTADLVPAHLALTAVGRRPALLLGPEHGFYGVEQDMVAAGDDRDPWTGAPIRSLYGDSPSSLRPGPEIFRDLDLLLVDLQDVGTRYYTYLATAVWAAIEALDGGCRVWVLDRPNPLGGEQVEGNLRRPGFESFVGAFPTPVRHGLTPGEMIRWRTEEEGLSEGLDVWPVEGWTPDRSWPDTGRPWMAPSPNMPSYETAVIYPGLCLLEATTLSEGRGTTRPFHLVGAPGLDGPELAGAIGDRQWRGIRPVPVRFRPQFQKHAGEVCEGVELVVTEPDGVEGYRTGVELLELLWERSGGEGFWREEPYEFVEDRPAVDLLAGTDELRRRLEEGEDLGSWIRSRAGEERSFREEIEPYLLYPRRGW